MALLRGRARLGVGNTKLHEDRGTIHEEGVKIQAEGAISVGRRCAL
jgi:hypothetical protein